MSDLKDSGSIEQDSDIVMLLHRAASYYGQNDDDMLIMDKQRNGFTGKIRMESRMEYFTQRDCVCDTCLSTEMPS